MDKAFEQRMAELEQRVEALEEKAATKATVNVATVKSTKELAYSEKPNPKINQSTPVGCFYDGQI